MLLLEDFYCTPKINALYFCKISSNPVSPGKTDRDRDAGFRGNRKSWLGSRKKFVLAGRPENIGIPTGTEVKIEKKTQKN